jgi:hypothetical protein
MAIRLSKEVAEQAVNTVDNHGGNIAAAAASLGLTRGGLFSRLERAKINYGLEPRVRTGEDESLPCETVIEEGDEKTIQIRTETPITTQKEAMQKAGLDEAIWEVVLCRITQHQVGMKLQKGNYFLQDPGNSARREFAKHADEPITRTMWNIHIVAKRRAAKALTDALDLIHERAVKYSPRYSFPKIKKSDGDLLAVMCLFDHHFGKLCWSEETGNNYDLKIAVDIWHNAVDDLLAYVEPLGVKKFLFPLGQDFMNFDNEQGTTTAGTPQDNDSRYAKVIDAAYDCLVATAERLGQIAPVHFEYVPGNHDLIASYHLSRELKRHFRQTKRVEVGTEFRLRKYHAWGVTLLGIAHADGVPKKWDRLPTIMATERPQDWGNTKTREWLLGHVHTKQKHETLPVEEKDGVVVRTLSSLSGHDYWHTSKGYMGTRACEAYLYSHSKGYVGHFNANARE